MKITVQIKSKTEEEKQGGLCHPNVRSNRKVQTDRLLCLYVLRLYNVYVLYCIAGSTEITHRDLRDFKQAIIYITLSRHTFYFYFYYLSDTSGTVPFYLI